MFGTKYNLDIFSVIRNSVIYLMKLELNLSYNMLQLYIVTILTIEHHVYNHSKLNMHVLETTRNPHPLLGKQKNAIMVSFKRLCIIDNNTLLSNVIISPFTSAT